MAQRQITTVLQMLAQRQAVQAQAQVQVQTQAQAQVQVQTRVQHNPYQSTVQPLTFAELAAQQKTTAPVASVKVQELLIQQQQAEQVVQQEQVTQPQTAQPPAYAVNPYLDPDVEMPPPEPFDISSLDYADHPPINPLAGAQHASKVNDPVYDQVYL